MSKYNRDAFEAWCESNNIETGRTVCVFEAWAKLQSERDELLEALNTVSLGLEIEGYSENGVIRKYLKKVIKKAEAK